MLLTDDLYKHLLVNPKTENPELNSLLVFSGYAAAAMASRYLEDLGKREVSGIKVNLIIGMTPRDGLRESDHKSFVDLMNDFPDKFSCSYIMNNYPPVHSKLFIWCEAQEPKLAFAGSANYTQSALFAKQGEIMTDCNPQLSLDYFQSFNSKTVYCNHSDAGNFVTFYRGNLPPQDSSAPSDEEDLSDFPSVKLSFLTQNGRLGTRSGLNWGQRPERDQNQAYIPLRAEIYGSDFFPEIGKHFTVLTDDDKSLTCSRAQQNGKAIHTPLNNSQMGEYFRSRLGISSGVMVTVEHLENYGRTDVKFVKLDEENYYMDFSQELNGSTIKSP